MVLRSKVSTWYTVYVRRSTVPTDVEKNECCIYRTTGGLGTVVVPVGISLENSLFAT